MTVLTFSSVGLVLIYGRVPLRDSGWVPPVVKELIREERRKGVLVIPRRQQRKKSDNKSQDVMYVNFALAYIYIFFL